MPDIQHRSGLPVSTSEVFTGVLKTHGIAISMDGRGRALDNIFVERLWRSVKHEDVYLNGYATMSELLMGLAVLRALQHGKTAPITGLRNTGSCIPYSKWRRRKGVDKYSEKEKAHLEIETKKETENRGSVVLLYEEGYPFKLDALLS